MQRLFFLTPNVKVAESVVADLKRSRVSEEQIHVIAREDAPMGDLPEADHIHQSDIVPGLEKGLAMGGGAGLLAGLLAVTFPPAGLALGGGAVLAMTGAGAGFGAWVSAMVGSSIPNTQIEQFEDEIKAGKLLMMVDVDNERADEIRSLIRRHHPQAQIGEGQSPLNPTPAEK